MTCAEDNGLFIQLNFPKPMIFVQRILVEILNPGFCPWSLVADGKSGLGGLVARGEMVGAGQNWGGGGTIPGNLFYAVYHQIFPPMWRFVCRGSFVGPHFPQKLTFCWFYGQSSGQPVWGVGDSNRGPKQKSHGANKRNDTKWVQIWNTRKPTEKIV